MGEMIDVSAILPNSLPFYEVRGQRLFPVISNDGSLCFKNVSYLVKMVPGQEGPEDGPMPLDPPITKLKDVTVCAVVFSGNETYKSAMQKIATAKNLLEAA